MFVGGNGIPLPGSAHLPSRHFRISDFEFEPAIRREALFFDYLRYLRCLLFTLSLFNSYSFIRSYLSFSRAFLVTPCKAPTGRQFSSPCGHGHSVSELRRRRFFRSTRPGEVKPLDAMSQNEPAQQFGCRLRFNPFGGKMQA
jgi:hypothetical protein